MQYIRLTSYQDNGGLAKVRAHARLTSIHIRTILKFTLVEDTFNRLHACSDYYSVLKDGSHNQSEQGVKDFC
jgi:hypothetical protein